MLPDSLTARASFTRGFPHYPNPNLPMTLRPVVNRCANSEHMIAAGLRIGQRSETKNPSHFKALQLAAGWPSMVIVSMMTGSSGTFREPPLVGTWPMVSMTSRPFSTTPKMV